MGRNKKDTRNLNCKVDKEVFNNLEQFVQETGLSKTITVEKALKMYLKNYNDTGKI